MQRWLLVSGNGGTANAGRLPGLNGGRLILSGRPYGVDEVLVGFPPVFLRRLQLLLQMIFRASAAAAGDIRGDVCAGRMLTCGCPRGFPPLRNCSASVPLTLCLTESNGFRFDFEDFLQISWCFAILSSVKWRPQNWQLGSSLCGLGRAWAGLAVFFPIGGFSLCGMPDVGRVTVVLLAGTGGATCEMFRHPVILPVHPAPFDFPFQTQTERNKCPSY